MQYVFFEKRTCGVEWGLGQPQKLGNVGNFCIKCKVTFNSKLQKKNREAGVYLLPQ